MAKKYGVAPKQITRWKKEFLEKSDMVFNSEEKENKELRALKSERDKLLKKVGQLTIEVDFFCGSLRGCGSEKTIRGLEKKRPAGMSRNRFCHLMKINRSSLYYERQGESEENLSTYIPKKRGFMYLYAIIDVYSHYIVGWRLRNTLEKANCIELLKECVKRHGSPEIINTDQGSQYTTLDWIQAVKIHGQHGRSRKMQG
ncbi:MAG: transposase [Paludibacteraceae bacterium]|nr:transposase [Paludibacteraceae bacterium]